MTTLPKSRYMNVSINRTWLNDLWRNHRMDPHRSERFGQRVLNSLNERALVFSELFYEKDDEKAYRMVQDNFYIVEDQ